MKERLKDQAIEACEDIFHEYPEFGVLKTYDAIKRAWQIGERSCSLNNKKLQIDGLRECQYQKTTYCEKDGTCHGCAIFTANN